MVIFSNRKLKLFCVFTGFPLPSWVHTKGQGKGTLTPSPQSETPESTAIEVEDIPALLRDVARFAEAVEKLKDVVMTEGKTAPRGGSQVNPHKKAPNIYRPACHKESGSCVALWQS